MIIDTLNNTSKYQSLDAGIRKAFNYLHETDLMSVAPGKYEIDGDDIFAIMQEYQTVSAEKEQLEAHKKYIDVQYIITGAEQVGHAFLHQQAPSKTYDEKDDYWLFADDPLFFSQFNAGTFMIFFPEDLHMPCIMKDVPATVKKVVIKVRNTFR